MNLFSSYKDLFNDYWNSWLGINEDLKQGKPISNDKINDLSKVGDDLENILVYKFNQWTIENYDRN